MYAYDLLKMKTHTNRRQKSRVQKVHFTIQQMKMYTYYMACENNQLHP